MKKYILGFALVVLTFTSCVQKESTASSGAYLPSNTEAESNQLGNNSIKTTEALLSNAELLNQLQNGNMSNLIIADKYPDEHAFELAFAEVKKNNAEWIQCDINQDGYEDLILQESKTVDKKIKRIIAIFSADKGKLGYHLWDVNDGTEYYFVAENGNLIYFYDSYGTYSLAAFHLYVFDNNWNKKCVQELTVYNEYDYDNDVSMGKTSYERDTLQITEEGTENWNNESITKEQFFEDFQKMTGVPFEEMKPEDLILWDEE